jgi:hypothetical protein
MSQSSVRLSCIPRYERRRTATKDFVWKLRPQQCRPDQRLRQRQRPGREAAEGRPA